MKTYYKVCYRLDNAGGYRSCVVFNGGFRYTPYVWTKRPDNADYGPMAVFETYADAKAFRSANTCHSTLPIFKARIKPSKDRFLKNCLYDGDRIVSLEGCPKGTVLADAVMITEEVKP